MRLGKEMAIEWRASRPSEWPAVYLLVRPSNKTSRGAPIDSANGPGRRFIAVEPAPLLDEARLTIANRTAASIDALREAGDAAPAPIRDICIVPHSQSNRKALAELPLSRNGR